MNSQKYIVALEFSGNNLTLKNFILWCENYPSEMNLIDFILVFDKTGVKDKLTNFNQLDLICRSYNIELIFPYCNSSRQFANFAFELSVEKSQNLLLLNDDFIPISNLISQINQCFLSDANLACVFPRAITNRIADCNKAFSSLTYLEKIDFTDRFKKFLNTMFYAPYASGPSVCIKLDVIKAFGNFEPKLKLESKAKVEYCLRVSTRGLRIAVLNHSFVQNFTNTDNQLANKFDLKEDIKFICKFYTYYPNLVKQFYRTVDYKVTHKIISGINNSEVFLIDASQLTPSYNGTSNFIADFILALFKLGKKCDVLVSEESAFFHQIHNLDGINCCKSVNGQYEVAIRLAQPFSLKSLCLLPKHSIFSICVFFDTIAHDCPQLLSKNPHIDFYWNCLPHLFSDIVFISNHSKKQFETKFDSAPSRNHAALLPFNFNKNSTKESDFSELEEKVIVFGNNHQHKGLDIALKQLPSLNNRTYYLMMKEFKIERNDIKFLIPGLVPEEELKRLFRESKFVVFPTFSEGFGLPIIESIGFEKNIFCRPLPSFLEIYSALPKKLRQNIIFVDDFTLKPDSYLDPKIEYHAKKFDNYDEYVMHILALANPSNMDYMRYKARFLFLSNMRMNGLFIVEYLINFVRKIKAIFMKLAAFRLY